MESEPAHSARRAPMSPRRIPREPMAEKQRLDGCEETRHIAQSIWLEFSEVGHLFVEGFRAFKAYTNLPGLVAIG